jgi:tetratricopeptide (TPR) repeat protein
VWARASILAFAMFAAAAVAAGCSAPAMERSNWFATGSADAARPARAPTVRVTQSDVVDLNEAVEGLARSENPGRYAEASKRLAALLPRFEGAGEDALAAQTLFWLAYCYEKTGRKEDAAVFYDQLIKRYPQAPAAEQARGRRGRMEFRRPPE